MTELFSIYDAAAKRFIDPFPSSTVEMATRGFREACETEGHQFQKFPEDYSLYHVGSFDPETGEVAMVLPSKVGVAMTYVPGYGAHQPLHAVEEQKNA